MKKIAELMLNKRYTHLLLTWGVGWSLLMMYGGKNLQGVAWWGMNLTLCSLALSISLCTILRCQPLLRQQQNILISFRKTKGLIGSLVFHLGLLIMLMGFLVNFLWSYQGIVFLPEGDLITIPFEYNVQKQAVLQRELPQFQVSLIKLDNTQQADQQGKLVSRPLAHLQFTKGIKQEQRIAEVNYPAHYQGLTWRQQSWGYSTFLKITAPDGVVVQDFVNIATHTDLNGQELKFYDKVPVSAMLTMEVRYEPERGSSPAAFADPNKLRDKRHIELKLTSQGKDLGQTIIPLGGTGQIGIYQIQFEQIRRWMAFDVGSDPGRYWLYLGGLLAVGGLLGTIGKYQLWGSEEKQHDL